MIPTHGLVQCDATDSRAFVEAADLSFTAFIVAAVGRAAAAHPEVHAYRNWRGRLALHDYVDVATLVEVARPGQSSFPMAHLIRDADIRSPAELSAELRSIQGDVTRSRSGRLFSTAAPVVGRIPGAMALFYLLAARSMRMRRMTGTVSVTSIGMFGGGGGFGIAHPTVQTLTVLVGGMSLRPWLHKGEIVPRTILDLTVSIDHNVVDGAPAARFVADLRRMIESPDL